MVDELEEFVESLLEYSVRLLNFVHEQHLEFPLQMMVHPTTRHFVFLEFIFDVLYLLNS